MLWGHSSRTYVLRGESGAACSAASNVRLYEMLVARRFSPFLKVQRPFGGVYQRAPQHGARFSGTTDTRPSASSTGANVNQPRLIDTAACIATGACMGVLSRVLLKQLQASVGCLQGAAAFPDLLCNAAGCFAMGALHVASPTSQNSHGAIPDWHAQNPGLSSGLRTGFCGSLTTFSSWMLTAFQAPGPACLMQLATGTAVALLLLQGGRAASRPLHQLTRAGLHACGAVLRTAAASPATRAAAAASAAAALLWLGHAAAGGSWMPLAATIAVAPAGALARWRLSSINAAGPRVWPLGTLLANMLACAAGFLCISPAACSRLPPEAASIIIVGVLGSLSTVSTWAEELTKMSRSAQLLRATGYWGVSIAGAAALSIFARL
eukprot:jgi/Ulvmu1/2983/UM015_0023.1